MADIDLRGGVTAKIPGAPVDEAPAGVDLLYVHPLPDGRDVRVVEGGGDTAFVRILADHSRQHTEVDDVGKVRVRLVSSVRGRAEEEHRRFHGVRRIEGFHLESVYVVPLPRNEVVDLEVMAELPRAHAHERGQLLFEHRRAHTERHGRSGGGPCGSGR